MRSLWVINSNLMFKELPFNPRYKFDLEGRFLFRGEVVENSGSPITLEDIRSGAIGTFDRVWLGLIAHHAVELPFDKLHYIHFLECKAKHFQLKSKSLMLFRSPIVLTEGFRVVPGFTRYHISRDGIISSHVTGNVCKIGSNAFGYPSVSIFDDDKQAYRNVVLHMLLARAWLPNKNPDVKLFVNHKDGVKENFSLENLEWVSGAENIAHAVKNGLTKSHTCEVLDLTNGEIEKFPSLGEARRKIGIGVYGTGPTSRKVNGEILPIVLGGRYVIRREDDPPFFDDLSDYNDLFLKRNVGPYYARRNSDREIFEAVSVEELSKKVGIQASNIFRAINSVVPLSFGGFIFKNSLESDWPDNYFCSEAIKKRSFSLENLETGDVIELDSLNKLKSIVGADKLTIGRKLASGKPYGKWFFKETSEFDSPLRRRRLSSISLIAGNSC